MHRNRKLNRLKGYNYSSNALYFVTSCVQDRICCFGEVRDHKMILNSYGEIAEQQLGWLEQQYSYVDLHAFVVMPNHIHCIIEIDNRMVNVGTGGDLSVQQQQETKIKSLSQLMGAYKTTSSKQIHLIEMDGSALDKDRSRTDRSRPVRTFKWQRSFHDHIIRNEESYFRISNYILNNPSNWKDDKFYNQ